MKTENNAVIDAKNVSEEELETLLEDEKNEIEEIEKEAELNAEQDSISEEDEELKIDYVVKFKKPYNFNGKEISEVDMSGIEDLTTLDGQQLELEMNALKHHPRAKYTDLLYCKHVAMRVTGLPADFFNMLRLKDMTNIVSTVTYYFLLG